MAGSEPNRIILKILSGTQSGVDVPLIDGDYTLGSSDDDDIQIFDVSLMAGHAKIAVRSGKVEIAGAAGQLRSRNGVTFEAKGDALELEPLDIVSAGTTRFALGPRNANWASITEANEDEAPEALRKRRASPGVKGATAAADLRWRSWHTAIPVSLVVALVALGIWFSSTSAANRNPSAEEIAKTELETVRSAIAAFDFTDAVEVRQEVDGIIYVTGFVEEPVQRRAIMTATRDLDVQARVRLSVLDTMRSEIENLLSEERVDVAHTVSPKGALTLSGVLLDDGRAEQIVALVTERVRGFSSITSEIETGPTLLAKVNDLATRSQITPLVIVRLDGALIEASGVLPTEKIDQWVGFLQSYASQFAASIPLRSLVQLQNPDGTLIEAPTAGNALVLGGQIETLGGLPLDVSKLRAGAFRMADIFVGQPREGEDAVAGPVGDAATVTPGTSFTGGDVAGLVAGTRNASPAGFDLSVLLGSELLQTAGLPSTDATSGG
ncbi:MAG: hypothetical protein H7Y08_06245, partial [Rhizobiaceae bacterium]|nr:hypothetical protein [Rhizobiaceae bacterium]